jgi:hypothetical protein
MTGYFHLAKNAQTRSKVYATAVQQMLALAAVEAGISRLGEPAGAQLTSNRAVHAAKHPPSGRAPLKCPAHGFEDQNL